MTNQSSSSDSPSAHRRSLRNWPWRSIIQVVLTIVLIGGIARLLYVKQHELAAIQQVSIGLLFLIYLNFLLDYSIIGTTLNTLVRPLGCKLRTREYLGLSYVSSLYNLVLPVKGGLFFRSYYLKTYKQFNLRLFALVTFVQSLVYLLIASILGIFFVLLSGRSLSGELLFILLYFLAFAVGSYLILHGHLLIGPLAKKFRIIEEATESWKTITHGRPFWSLAAQTFVRVWLPALRIYLTFNALGLSVSLPDALLAGLTLAIIGNFSFTPGNLGIRELVMTFVMGLLGYIPSQVLLVGVIERVVQLAVLVPAGLGSLYGIFHSVRKLPPTPASAETD